MLQVANAAPAAPVGAAVTSEFKVDAFRAGRNARVQSQWFNRPADQRFLDLGSLHAHVKAAAEASVANVIDVRGVRVIGSTEDSEALTLELPDGGKAAPNHWSFGQVCTLLGAPAGYLRKLPSAIAGINMQYALANFREECVKTYVRADGSTELRAVTGPDYGRIHDFEIVEAVQKIAGNGTGDTNWKVPGMLNWGNGTYNPFVDISKETTTLFASDRDVFLFLVDDTHPIEIGKLPNGDPDLVFRGFYVWNSEVGSKAAGIATFYLRGVCCNRMLWGVENFNEVKIYHFKHAPKRFASEAVPALESYASGSVASVIAGVQRAKEAVVARTDEDREEFLGKQGFSRGMARHVIGTVLREEGKKPESIWDFVQGITAAARAKPHQDARLDMERVAGRLLDKVAA